MVNPQPPSGVPDPAMDPREVYLKYTKLLRKRRTYQRYFEKGLPLIDLALQKVLINASTKVVRPHAIFGKYSRESGTPFLRMSNAKYIKAKIPEGAAGKEREILKKYSCRVEEKRFGREKKRAAKKKKARDAFRRKAQSARMWRREAIDHAEVLRSAARAAGVEAEPEVVSYLGAQIRPPPDVIHGWIKEPEIVTRGEVNQALKHFGKKVKFTERRQLSSGSERPKARERRRRSTCNTCGYEGDGQPGYCPHCEARLSVFWPAKGAKGGTVQAVPREKKGGFVIGEVE